MFAKTSSIEIFDSELSIAIQNETQRQEEHIELIASENYASPRVMEAQGSVLTNKLVQLMLMSSLILDHKLIQQSFLPF